MSFSLRKVPWEWGLVALTTALLVAVVLSVSGCASSPRAQYAQVQDGYISAVTVLIEARVQGVFDDEEWGEDILPLIDLGNDLLDEYDALTRTGLDGQSILRSVQNVLVKLTPYIVRATSEGT